MAESVLSVRPASRRRPALLLATAPGDAVQPAQVQLGSDWEVAGSHRLAEGGLATTVAWPAEGGTVIVLLSERAPDTVRDPILALAASGCPLRILPWSPPQRGAGAAVPEHYAAPLSSRGARLKRALDLALGGPALLLLLPLMAAVALAIRRDSPGPALFRQHRVGCDGRVFEMYKFRTMYHQPEQAEAALRAAAPDTPPPPGQPYKLPNDPRITRVGRFLRRSSLDELPQLLNVLRGEMSLVGPRPELPGIVARYHAWQLARLAVPPGMTGWWQVNGRSNHPMHLSTDDDLYYLAHYSLLLDLRILARTVTAVIRGTGAY